MLRKLFVFLSLTALTAISVAAQDASGQNEKRDLERSLYSIAIAGNGGYLGVGLKEVSSKNYQELGLSEVRGVAITSVQKESAAEKAGLQEGDVIVSIDGQRVTSTRKFSRIVREIAPDHTVNLTIVRGGSELQIPVTMGRRSPMAFRSSQRLLELADLERELKGSIPKISVNPPNIEIPEGVQFYSFGTGRMIGVGVTRVTKQLGEYFGVQDGKGLLINDVTKDGPADKAGLRAGDVITKINGEPVKNTFDLLRGMGKEEGDVTITFLRDRSEQTVTVTPEKRKGNYFFRTKKEKKDKDN